MASTVKKLVSEHDENDTEADRDSNSAFERPNMSTLRNSTTVSSMIRKSLQTCSVQNNEEKLEGLLNFYTRRKSKRKIIIIEALSFVLRHHLEASSFRDNQGKGFLPFDEAYGLFISFFDFDYQVECANEQFRGYLLDPEYGFRGHFEFNQVSKIS